MILMLISRCGRRFYRLEAAVSVSLILQEEDF